MQKTKAFDAPACEECELHADAINRSKSMLPEANVLGDLSLFFKVVSDPSRLSILLAIDGEELCACDIAKLLGMTKSAVSHQMKTLRQASLVSYRKSGKNVFYSLADDHVKDIIEKALEHIKE